MSGEILSPSQADPYPASPSSASPAARRYGRRSDATGRLRRRWRRVWRLIDESAREIQWLIPAFGATGGVLLAVWLVDVGPSAEQSEWAITVGRARSTLMGWLSLVFAGFSIVLAVATLTIQNVVGRFSLRMLRVYQRDLRDRAVIAVFALTATFIVTQQIRLRSLPEESIVPFGGAAAAIGLLILTGVVVIWYITTIAEWFRVDSTARRLAALALDAARYREISRRDSEDAHDFVFTWPHDGLPILAHRSGFLTDVDVEGLFELVQGTSGEVVINRTIGSAIVRDEPVGWIRFHDDNGTVGRLPEEAGEMLLVSNSQPVGGSVGYSIRVLVDIAIMALSPSVNDPNTAVQVLDELTFLFSKLSGVALGPYAMFDTAGRRRVVVNAASVGDHLSEATRQIVLYGHKDPAVVLALRHLAATLAKLEFHEADRRQVATFIASVEKLAMPATTP